MITAAHLDGSLHASLGYCNLAMPFHLVYRRPLVLFEASYPAADLLGELEVEGMLLVGEEQGRSDLEALQERHRTGMGQTRSIDVWCNPRELARWNDDVARGTLVCSTRQHVEPGQRRVGLL